MFGIIARAIHWVFLAYTILLFLRVFGSWFPRFTHHPIMRFARLYTDPYLNFFRRFIPPLGGTLDLSPILGFFALEIIERMVLWLLRVLF